MLDVLENPLTEEYMQLKQHILSADFPLHWVHATCNGDTDNEDVPYLSHAILRRSDAEKDGSGTGSPIVGSPVFDRTRVVFDQILDHNDVGRRCFYRMNVNMTMPSPQRMSTSHTDHSYPHTNVLIYLNGFDGGHTWVGGVEGPQPTEDMVVSFNGVPHQAAPPLDNRRMVLLATYGEDEDTTSWVEVE